MNERDKMLAGEWYDASDDADLDLARMRAKDLCFELNHTRPSDRDKQETIVEELLGYRPTHLELMPPFQVDFGNNVFFGKNVHINHGCYFMDAGRIIIGNDVYFGPNVGLYTARHPLGFAERNTGKEQALPIKIGDNVWFGGNVVVLPGITIGSGAVLSAGSVITRDVPENAIMAGVPAKIVKGMHPEEDDDETDTSL